MNRPSEIAKNAASSEADSNISRSGWITGLVFVLLSAIVVLFITDRLYQPDKFRIEHVEVRGQLNHVNGDQVRMAVEDALDGNYFSASLESIEWRIRKLPWVFDTSVRRQWPSTLIVDVEEVQPIAEWGDSQWLNASGDLVQREPWNGHLPVLRGPDSMQQLVWQAFQNWHEMFAAYGLSLDQLEFDQRELWYLTLSLTALAYDRNAPGLPRSRNELSGTNEASKSAVKMIIDNVDATNRIERLIKALNSQLIAEFPAMKSIDLRYPNGFAINWIAQSPDVRKLTESQ